MLSETKQVITAKRAKQLLRSIKGLPNLIQETNAIWVVVRFLNDNGQPELAKELDRICCVDHAPWAAIEGTEIEP